MPRSHETSAVLLLCMSCSTVFLKAEKTLLHDVFYECDCQSKCKMTIAKRKFEPEDAGMCVLKIIMFLKIGWSKINNFRYADDTPLMAESEEELKNLLMRVKEENEKAGLKLSTNKTRITAFSPITSWQIEGGKVEAVTDLIFLVSKITADGECSYEIKRHLLLGRKAITNLGSILKSRDITFLNKCPYSQSYVFVFSFNHAWM